jgi:capsular polysaccharide export protein
MTDPGRHAPAPVDIPEAPRGMIDGGLSGFRGRRVMMLQGPLGPFFSRLATDLREHGAEVVRVVFNGGDRLFAPRRAYDALVEYRGRPEDWPPAFESLVRAHRIDTVLLFGDCRPVHVPAIAIAKRLGIEVGAFEEGYLRPDYVTIEREGVNHHSLLPKDPEFYRRMIVAEPPATATVGSTFGAAARWGMLYYCAASLGRLRYRHHVHHRPLGWLECRHWVRSGWRKLRYRLEERAIGARLVGDDRLPYFLVALQTQGDAQVRVHSKFQSVERFIEHVMHEFAAHAPTETHLVFKHHPLDRGFSDHSAQIRTLAHDLGLAPRCHYIHDQHLPTLLRGAIGVVTINSTVGLSAVGEGLPVAVCGRAIYDIPGLTFQGPLAAFWRSAAQHPPDYALWRAFRNVLIASTQFNGSFYKRLPQAMNASGVFWDKRQQIRMTDGRHPWIASLRPMLPARFANPPADPAATPPTAARPAPTRACDTAGPPARGVVRGATSDQTR